jgi:hypothetical protein
MQFFPTRLGKHFRALTYLEERQLLPKRDGIGVFRPREYGV